MLSRVKGADEWQEICKLELCQEIRSLDDYLSAVLMGEAIAGVQALVDCQVVPSIEYIRHLHFYMFSEAHPWAGRFNEPGDNIWFGGMLSCDPRFILRELAQLNEQAATLLKPGTDEAKARMIAFYHAKFERIHPFKDGNGRVGRMIVESQMNALFGPFGKEGGRRSISAFEYDAALRRAQRKSNIRTLTNLILRADERPELPNMHECLPFRLHLYAGTVQEKMERRRQIKVAQTMTDREGMRGK